MNSLSLESTNLFGTLLRVIWLQVYPALHTLKQYHPRKMTLFHNLNHCVPHHRSGAQESDGLVEDLAGILNVNLNNNHVNKHQSKPGN